MPLVHSSGGEQKSTARQRRARKIKPQYAEGELVKVARAQHQSEGEVIEGLLLEVGIRCMLRRARGFDVGEMLAAGPRDVLVPASGAQAAREALAWEAPASAPRSGAAGGGEEARGRDRDEPVAAAARTSRPGPRGRAASARPCERPAAA